MTDSSSIQSTSALTRETDQTETDSESYRLAVAIARAADDRKGGDLIVLRVSEVSYLADYFIIVTGYSRVQVRAISDSIAHQAEQECQRAPRRVEGQYHGSWLVQDYGDVIVHILMPTEREYYNLEAFWGHGERLDLSAELNGTP